MLLSNSNAPIKGKRYIQTSYNVDDVIERAPRDDKGNVTLMAKSAKQEFILHIATKQKLQSCVPGNNKVQTMFTPILIPDKNTRKLRNVVNLMSKMFNLSFLFLFLCSDKKPSKSGRKTIHHEPVHVG